MSSHRLSTQVWNAYKSLIERLMTDSSASATNGLLYWQNMLFTRAITYALPVSLLVLVACVILQLQAGHQYIAVSDIFMFAFVMFIALNNRWTLSIRKVLISFAITLSSVAMIVLTGALAMGFIYLFGLGIFISLQFSSKSAYRAVAINFIICASVALLIYFQPFKFDALMNSVKLNDWLIYSANFLMMNLIVVGLICQLLTGLDETTHKVSFLHHELYKEAAEKNYRDAKLKESEMEHYKALEDRNQQLQEIAYLQSHIVRRPLANIKGISELLMHKNDIAVEKQLLHYLDLSVNELDLIINEIVKRSEGDTKATFKDNN